MNAPFDKTSTTQRSSQTGLIPARPAAPAPAPAVVARPGAAAAPGQEQEGPPPDIGAMIRRVFAHWQVIIVTMLIGAVVTAQVVRTRVPSFKSETVIFYREGIGKSITGPTEDKDSLRALGTKLKETLLAQQTLRRIIDEFHLYPQVVQKSGYADAVDHMRKKTDFKSRSTDTFAISFEGTTREEAQRVCARMAEILVEENAKRLSETNRSTTEFLEVEKKRADEELERVEREISEFLNAHPEFAGSKEGLGTEVMAQQKMVTEEQKKRAAAARRATGGGGGRRARPAPGVPAPVGGGADKGGPAVDPVLIAAKTAAIAELGAARKDLNEKSLKYTDQHPDVRAAQARLAAAEANLQRAEEAVAAAAAKEEAPPPRKVAHIDDPYGGGEDAGAPAAPLSPSAVAAASAAAEAARPIATEPQEKVVSLEVEWTRLQRALVLVRGRQSDLEGKLYKAEMIASTAESGYGTTIAVLDPAYKPSGPSNAPNKTVVVIGLGASIAVGVVLSAAWGLFLDDRLFSAGEVEGSVMVPVLGTIPRDEKKKDKKGKKGKASGDKAKVDKAVADAKAAARAKSEKAAAARAAEAKRPQGGTRA